MTVEQGPLSWLVKRGIDWLSKGQFAKTSGRLHLPGLKARVEVIRDRWGVPHIYADNDTDLFFAQGFVHAQDRFWQMEFQRRVVAGRLAELVGETGLAVDRWMRVLGMYQVAEQEVDQLDGISRSTLEAYAAGVNAWLKFRHLPVEFTLLRSEPEPWCLADSLAWAKMLDWMLSANWEAELLRQQISEKLGPEMVSLLELEDEQSWPLILALPDMLHLEENLARLARPWVGPGAGDGVGSNNWVVSGERTVTGKPILANDMHLLLSVPAIWYENHLVGGDYNVTGVSLPGLPLVVSGHNQSVAWGFTAGFADTQDLYEEHLRRTPEGGMEYEFQGEWHPAEIRREEIRVRFSATVVEEVVVTRHGPIINPLVESDGSLAMKACLALRWTGLETGHGAFQAMMKVNQAQNCVQLHEALRTWNVSVLNTVYADSEGNIGYTLAGKVPIRAQGEGKIPVPGWTGEYEWTGYIPLEDLPYLYNPPSGYIATANNRTASPDYPFYLGRDYVTSDRAERIAELILRQPKIDLAYVQMMHIDQVSPSAQTFARLVGQLSEADPRMAEVIERMRNWDGTLAASSIEATIYEVLTRELLKVLFEHRLGEQLMQRFAGSILNELNPTNLWGQHAWEWLRREMLRPDSPWFDLGSGETRDDVLLQALERTVAYLTAELGPEIENWAWGRFHTVTFQHIFGRVKPLDTVFNRGPYPVGGDGNTIWATATVLDKIESSDGMVGPPSRFIADLANLDQALGILAPGQSGQVGSPHYDDQIEDWFKGGYHPMLYNRQDVLREQEACLDLLP